MSELAPLADGGLDDAELERRVTRFEDALRRVAADPDEATRLEAMFLDTQNDQAHRREASPPDVEVGTTRRQEAARVLGLLSPAWPGDADSRERPQEPVAASRPVGRRPQNPLPDTAVGAVSAELRRQREEAGLRYRDLADLAGYSLATVTAACGGRQLPSWKVVRACLAACGGDEELTRSLYERACIEEGRPVPESASAVTEPPDPAGAATGEQLVECMAGLRAWAGNPPLADLNQRSGGHLPPSTISGVLRRGKLPRRDLVVRYARACGLPDSEVRKWEAAWENIKTGETPATGATEPAGSPRRTPAAVCGSVYSA